MSNATAPFITIRHKEAYVKIYISSIVYLEAEGTSTNIHVTKPDIPEGCFKYPTGYNLGYYKDKIGSTFFRIHAKRFLNLDFFKQLCVNHTVELTDSKFKPLDVSRRAYSKLLKFVKG